MKKEIIIAIPLVLAAFVLINLSYTKVLPSPACIQNWSCTPWNECIQGQMERFCFDASGCGNDAGKPQEIRTCECESSWACANWEPVKCQESQQQTRICSDLNNCQEDKTETQNCTYKKDFTWTILITILILILVIIIILTISRRKSEYRETEKFTQKAF